MIELSAKICKDSKSGRVFLTNNAQIYVEVVLHMESGKEVIETYQEVIRQLDSNLARITLSTNEKIPYWYKINAEKFKKSFIHFFLTYQEPVFRNNMYVYELEPVILEDSKL